MGYRNDDAFSVNRGGREGVKVEKTGGDYTRVASPYVGDYENNDQLPLHDYAQPSPHVGGGAGGGGGLHQGYEPYRHA